MKLPTTLNVLATAGCSLLEDGWELELAGALLEEAGAELELAGALLEEAGWLLLELGAALLLGCELLEEAGWLLLEDGLEDELLEDGLVLELLELGAALLEDGLALELGAALLEAGALLFDETLEVGSLLPLFWKLAEVVFPPQALMVSSKASALRNIKDFFIRFSFSSQ